MPMLEKKAVGFLYDKDELKVEDKTASSTASRNHPTPASPGFVLVPDVGLLDVDGLYDFACNVEEENNEKTRVLLPNEHIEDVPNPVNSAKYQPPTPNYILAGPKSEYIGNQRFFKNYSIPGCGKRKVKIVDGIVPKTIMCGDFFSLKICTCCGAYKPLKNTCFRPSCPVCWKRWATREGERIGERFRGFKVAWKDKTGNRLGNPIHAILSPPPEEAELLFDNPNGVELLRQKAITIAKRNGIRGGVVITHPWRIKPSVKKLLIAHLREINTHEVKHHPKKLWALVHEDALGLGSWMNYVGFAPHAHIIGHGKVSSGDTEYAKSGWIVKFIRHINADSGRTYEQSISNLAYYLLSHTSVKDGKKSVAWFGTLGYNQLAKIHKCEEYAQEKCEFCGGAVIVYNPATGRVMPAIQKKVWWEYKIRKPKKRKKLGKEK